MATGGRTGPAQSKCRRLLAGASQSGDRQTHEHDSNRDGVGRRPGRLRPGEKPLASGRQRHRADQFCRGASFQADRSHARIAAGPSAPCCAGQRGEPAARAAMAGDAGSGSPGSNRTGAVRTSQPRSIGGGLCEVRTRTRRRADRSARRDLHHPPAAHRKSRARRAAPYDFFSSANPSRTAA